MARKQHEERDPRPSPEPSRYTPPRLLRLGNVRDVLGKTGANKDASKVHAGRP